MRLEQLNYLFLGVLAAGVIGVTAWSGSQVWYLNLILLCLFVGIFYAIRNWHDRAFYLVCAGEPLIVACGAINLWAGVFVVWMVAGIVCNAMGLLEFLMGIKSFVLFCGIAAIVAILIQVSNHVLLPLLILTAGTGAILAVQAVRDHQFTKQFGASP
jgi:hypothetical protein